MKVNIYKLLMIALAVMVGFLIVSGQGKTDPPMSFQPPGIVENIIGIIQNDTIRSFEVWKYEYETESDVIKYPQILIADLDYELLDRIPAKFPNNLLKYEPLPNCTQIGVQGYHSNPVSKHYVTFTRDSVDYVLCFYVLDWDPNVDTVEINYSIQVARYWY